jgi:hypothetical protein
MSFMKGINRVFFIMAWSFVVIPLVLSPNILQASQQQQQPPLPPPPQQQQQQQPPLPPPPQQQQQPPLPPPPQQQPPSGQQIGNGDNVVATGTINSILFTGPTNWIATGNWNMKIEDGDVEDFVTTMIWYNTNGTLSHTHEIRNFILQDDNEITLTPSSTITLRGESDVGTNGNIDWDDVPTTIQIGGGRTISITLDDDETDNHFARQPIYGVVASLRACGEGTPGPNMQVLQPC